MQTNGASFPLPTSEASLIARYVQRGKEYHVNYPVLTRRLARILGVAQKLVSSKEQILVTGEGFSPQVEYLCGYSEAEASGNASSAHFVAAKKVQATEVTCPGFEEVPASLVRNTLGFRCLVVSLKDPVSGQVVRPETPSVSPSRVCVITDLGRLVAGAGVIPRAIPLLGAPPRTADRILTLELVADSPISKLIQDLGAL